jgi:hypothetical protein
MGVVDGANGHLVKDRMEQAGMRWTWPSAQVVLDVRAMRLNDDWDISPGRFIGSGSTNASAA